MLRFAVSIAIVCVWMVCDTNRAFAHDLPISNLTIVAAKDTMHVELVLNIVELSFFSEIDSDKNGFADPAEVGLQSDQISRKIADCFLFQIDGKPVAAAVHGVVPNFGTHHLTIRAHYTCDAREASVHLESHLAAITNRSHVIEVVFHRPNSRQAARLDARDPEVLFDYEGEHDVAATPSKLPGRSILQRNPYAPFIGLAVLLGSLFCLLGKKKSKGPSCSNYPR